MVISSLKANTAKTIGTLAHNLNLSQYENIIILDDDGRRCWCKHEMFALKLMHNVNFMLLQVPEFRIWKKVHYLYRELEQSGWYSQPQKSQTFYALIAAKQNEDSLFSDFHSLLESMQNGTDNIRQFARPIKDMNQFGRLSPLTWWEWFKFKAISVIPTE